MFSLKEEIPRSTDLVIVGGGLVGSAVAFFVAHKQTNREREIMVIERDPMVRVVIYSCLEFYLITNIV